MGYDSGESTEIDDYAAKSKRQQWGKQAEFILACLGYAVGLGNVWRFPYLCYKSGGGAFLIPYFITLFLCGIPLLYMELAIGQFTRQGPIGALWRLCPLFAGAGAATVVISLCLATYYNVIISWAFYYLFQSFRSVLPWSLCNQTWNTDLCWEDRENLTRPNNSRSPSEEFFKYKVLQQSSGLEESGEMLWQLALLLLLCWIIVYLCLFKGTQSSGKVVYFTATFPYLILIVMLVRGVTLPGSLNGITYFVTPKWYLLGKPEVWVNAAAQNFNSIGIAFGSMIALASYNKVNQPICRDVFKICLLNSATSLLAGFAIFSILGFIAKQQNQDVEDVVEQGPGLIFVTYPAAFSTMWTPQLWSVLFFFMVILLGIDSQFCTVEVILTSLQDHFGKQIDKYFKRKEVLVLVVCACLYLLGLPNVTQGGIYFFQIIDYYAAGVSLMYIAFFETMAVCWVYGARRLSENILWMTGSKPFVFFVVCWYFFSPVLILAIWGFSWYNYSPVKYDTYVYPRWGQALGWCIASLSIMCIPVGAIYAIVAAEGSSFLEKLKNSITPDLTGLPVQGIDRTPVSKSVIAEGDRLQADVSVDGIQLTQYAFDSTKEKM